ncbi:MAG: hypothetical protein M3N91_19080 [Pseudomonadota bacterium]|nr:hypothetical protein [Pseudomonadota bacterium]
MSVSRERNLDSGAISRIVTILDGWSGKLTWDLLIDAIRRHLRADYTRQALHKHERIKQAFAHRKKALSSEPASEEVSGSPELRAALERIGRLEGENGRLEAENQRLLEQFACWAYNAHTRGLDHAFLSRPLPSVNRDQTAKPLSVVKSSSR